MLARWLIVLALIASAVIPASAEETLGDKIKKVFATPTPTPHQRKSSSSVSKKKTGDSSPSPSPKKKKKLSPTPTATPEATASPPARKKTTPEPEETPIPSATEGADKKHGAPNASLTADAITGFDKYPEKVQQVLNSALELTTRNLYYKYGSADPSTGGMDCSGFVYYVLKQNGVGEVPRDSSGQYVWLRRAGTFEAVVSNKEDSFEFGDLRAGDLLFWTGTYSIDRDPPITHAMIYLGRQKKDGARVMVGATDGRTYDGQQRYGVSVFDFKMPHADKSDGEKLRPHFIGYGHIPGLEQ
ncbi:MAG: C40 family peptidase [Verrucomicrobiota bacterium]|nr:C40 family peptidase [Verrucomicrobiota bacterium]